MYQTTLEATENNNYDEVVRLHEAGAPWDWKVKATAAKLGNLEILQYAHTHGMEYWPPFTTTWAAEGGQLDCLIFARSNGCPWRNTTSELASQNGHLHVVEYLLHNGCPVESPCIAYAAKNGHLSVVKFLVENNITLHPYAITWATQNHHDEVVTYIQSLSK